MHDMARHELRKGKLRPAYESHHEHARHSPVVAFSQTSLAGAVSLPAWAAPLGANGDVRVAVIGFRGRGGGHINELLKCPACGLVALCDVDSAVVDKKVADLDKKGVKVKTYRDFRECCADKDVDAVTIATPNHSHVLIALTALQHGKHVYVEKPVSHNLIESAKLMAAATKPPRRALWCSMACSAAPMKAGRQRCSGSKKATSARPSSPTRSFTACA
jgi:hypothetical protein